MSDFWTLNFGQIVTLIAYLAGGIAFVMALKSDVRAVNADMTNLKNAVEAMERDINKLTDVLVALGRQDERLTAMDKRIDEIRRGEGLIGST